LPWARRRRRIARERVLAAAVGRSPTPSCRAPLWTHDGSCPVGWARSIVDAAGQ
jgi:hypothetical protein